MLTRLSISALFIVMVLCLITASGPLRAASGEASSQTLSGKWEGRWHSQSTGHQGPLQAHIRPSADGHYRATFTGRFFKVIPFRYQMQLNVVANDGQQLTLAGSKKLGPLMGYYSYRATVAGNHLSATYSTQRDRGTFSLQRR